MTTDTEPPEWQGDPLGTYGPDRSLSDEDREAFDVERAPTTATCGHYDSREDQFNADVRPCGADALYRFKVRDTDDYAWTYATRCREHASGPDPDALTLPQATTILWQDAAEAYPVCSAHYQRHKRDQWAGSTPNPHQDELREALQDQIDEGRPCAFCERDAEKAEPSGA